MVTCGVLGGRSIDVNFCESGEQERRDARPIPAARRERTPSHDDPRTRTPASATSYLVFRRRRRQAIITLSRPCEVPRGTGGRKLGVPGARKAGHM